MKKSLLILSLFCAYYVNAQNRNPENAKMKPEMTEFWDPEVTVITPGETPRMLPLMQLSFLMELLPVWIRTGPTEEGKPPDGKLPIIVSLSLRVPVI